MHFSQDHLSFPKVALKIETNVVLVERGLVLSLFLLKNSFAYNQIEFMLDLLAMFSLHWDKNLVTNELSSLRLAE